MRMGWVRTAVTAWTAVVLASGGVAQAAGIPANLQKAVARARHRGGRRARSPRDFTRLLTARSFFACMMSPKPSRRCGFGITFRKAKEYYKGFFFF